MTIHISKMTLKNFKEWYMVGINQLKRYVVGIREQKNFLQYMEQYRFNSVFGWYTKVIEKFEIKIYSTQSAIQKFWYMSGIQSKKKLYEVVYQPFFAVCCLN